MDARISVVSVIDGDRIEGVYRGTYTYGETGVLLEYGEPEGSDLGPCRVRISARPGFVGIQRRGRVHMLLPLEDGRSTRGAYRTPFGDIRLRAETRKLHARLDTGGGSLHVRYRLAFEGQEDGQNNELTVKIEVINERNTEDELDR